MSNRRTMHLLAERLAARREELRRVPLLRDLAAHIGRDLEPLLRRPLYLPEAKPLLSRDGGTCPADGARLRFDPLSPHSHRCPRCEGEFTGERHHLAWVWRYHLWLSQRAVHLALLHGLLGEERYSRRAADILTQYGGLYRLLPNSDNVLGPSRLFFSTYLESIWLVQLLIAARLLAESGAGEGWREELSRMVGESVGLIYSFDEGWSNRQVWNNAALLAAGDWLEDGSLMEAAVDGPHGIRAQLRECVSDEGLWFEGENYHLFALRGMLLAAELAYPHGRDLYSDREVGPRLAAMYLAPLETMLPDLSLPARADAPFGAPLQRPELAEVWEVGWARTGDGRIQGFLAELYEREGPGPGSSFGVIAEQQENAPSVKLSRARLGWKALFWMRADSPRRPNGGEKSRARLLASSGIAVLRNEGGAYASVECGANRGGHGHPDLLHVSLYWDAPVLQDFGTASYTSSSLRWYRSTLAHNAPGVPGVGQLARNGSCEALDEREGWSWCRCVASDIFGSGTRAVRSLVMGPRYVIDIVELDVPETMEVDLPVHPLVGAQMRGDGRDPRSPPTLLPAGALAAGRGHGYDAVADVRVVEPTALGTSPVRILPRQGETLYVATAPGPPDRWYAPGKPLSFLVRRAPGGGKWIQLYDPGALVAHARVVGERIVVDLEAAGEESVIVREEGVLVTDSRGMTHRLGGTFDRTRVGGEASRREWRTRALGCPLLDEVPSPPRWRDAVPATAVIALDERSYRRSERRYGERGPFRALVAVFVVGERVVFAAEVEKSDLCFRDAQAADPALDNETPDIHSDGVECFLDVRDWEGYLVVPVPGRDEARVSGVLGTAADPGRVAARWAPTPHGYSVVVSVDTARAFSSGDGFRANLVVNEMYPERVRRAGQLVLSGDAGWVYLRGDRESAAGALRMEVQ